MHKAAIVLTIVAALAVSTSFYATGERANVAAPCAQGDMNIVATFPNDTGFENMWKYTISGSWDTGAPNGLSHISFIFALDCPCACEIVDLVQFDSPAGTATGTDSLGGPCTVEFEGLFNCDGDPTISNTLPAVKFEAPEGQDCEMGETGSGTWCFYTFLSPLPDSSYSEAVVVKFGTNECTGSLIGALPDCGDCETIPVENKTWGGVKLDYGD